MRKLLLLISFFILGLTTNAQETMTIIGDQLEIDLLDNDGSWIENTPEDFEHIIFIDASDSTITIATEDIEFVYFITNAYDPEVLEDDSLYWRMEFVDETQETGTIRILIDPDFTVLVQVAYSDNRLNFFGYIME